MKPFSYYTRIPDGFNTEYVIKVYGAVSPVLFISGILVTALSFFIIGIGALEIVRGRNFGKISGKSKILIGLLLMILAGAITKWYLVIFYPDQFLQLIL